jgi:hypothetical protein
MTTANERTRLSCPHWTGCATSTLDSSFAKPWKARPGRSPRARQHRKSRLVAEATAVCRSRGFRIVQAVLEQDRAPPRPSLSSSARHSQATRASSGTNWTPGERGRKGGPELLPACLLRSRGPDQEKPLVLVLGQVLFQLASQGPLLIVVEDLHWARNDPAVSDLLHATAADARTARCSS